jgi:hypothetical protein
VLTETAGTFHREVAAEERPYKPFSNFVPSTTTAAEKAVLAYTIKVLREKGGGLEGGAMDVLACETEPGVGGNSMQGPGVGAVRGGGLQQLAAALRPDAAAEEKAMTALGTALGKAFAGPSGEGGRAEPEGETERVVKRAKADANTLFEQERQMRGAGQEMCPEDRALLGEIEMERRAQQQLILAWIRKGREEAGGA